MDPKLSKSLGAFLFGIAVNVISMVLPMTGLEVPELFARIILFISLFVMLTGLVLTVVPSWESLAKLKMIWSMEGAFAYLLAIALAQIATLGIHPVWGMTVYIIILIALVLHSALTSRQVYHQLLLSFSLVPLIRIISLSMPLAGIPQLWWYPIIYAPLLVAALQVTRLLGYSWGEIGFKVRGISIQLAIALTGFGFGLAEFFILTDEARATGVILGKTPLLAGFLLMVTTGFVEEVIFRGVLQRSAVETLGGWWGLVYVSLLFAIAPVSQWIHRSLLDIVFVFVVAMFFGWVVKKTGSLFGVTLAHGIANIVLFLVAPLLF